MNKYDFLSRLRNALSPLPQEERDAAMNYYEEFFTDAGEDNEQSVIASLGTPEELAKQIIEENNRENPAYNNGTAGAADNSGFTPPPTPAQTTAPRWTGGQIALFVVLAVFSSPIWLGALCAIFGVIVGIFGALIGIIGGFGAAAIACFAAGVAALISEPIMGITMIGIAFIFAGLFPLAIYPLCKLTVKGVKACVKGIASLINKITGRKETAK